MNTVHLHDLTISVLRALVREQGEPDYRYRQLAGWLYARLATGFDEMTDLPQAWRERLAATAVVSTACPAAVQESHVDGTRKFLFALADGEAVEAVLMPYEDRTTLCVSSQVGCPLDCTFCETAKGRFRRNLTTGEIIDQICTLKAAAGLEDSPVNVVFMGMGEPLLNFDAVVDAVRILTDPLGLALAPRRVTVSTSSFPDRIRALANSDAQCSLALSLNAADDAKRRQLMPKASRFSIAELLDAARYFAASGRRRVTLEYVMLEGFNTGPSDAEALRSLIADAPFKLNLIPYNPGRNDRGRNDRGRDGQEQKAPDGDGRPWRRSSEADIDRFVQRVLPFAPTVTVRRSRGADIDAACGQLWTRSLAGDGKERPVEGLA